MTNTTAIKAIDDVPTPQCQNRAGSSKRFVTRIERVFGLIFCMVVLLNFVSAALRYAGGGALVGADEVQVYVMVWLIFLGAAAAGIRQMHLRMDIFVQRLGPKLGWWRGLFESILSLAICSLMTWISLSFAGEMMTMGQRSDGAGIPMWLVHGAPAAGFLGLALASGWDLVRLGLDRRAAGAATESAVAP